MFQIKWTKKALLDLAETLKYWNIHNSSETYSKKLRLEVKKKQLELSENPKIGIKTVFDEIYKIKILKYYSLFFRIEKGTIEILAFWDNRRNPDNLEP